MNTKIVNIIGGGYAGIEAALTLANLGVEVHLFNLPRPKPQQIENSQLNKRLLKELLSLQVSSLDDNNLTDLCLKNEKKLNKNAKIMIFDKKVSEISLYEPTIIATGNDTDEDFIDQLEDIVGKSHFVRYGSYFPEFKGRINGIRDGEYIYLPLSTMELENIRKFLCQFSSDKHTIEKYAKSGLQIFRAKVAKAELVKGKVYEHVLKLKKVSDAWRLFNFQTELKPEDQDRLFQMIEGLKNAKVTRYGRLEKFSHINSSSCLSPYLQSQAYPNIFFAGALLGVSGELEAIALGHLAALNLFNMLHELPFVTFPKASIVGQVLDKLFLNNGLKSEQILKSCDIIEKTQEDTSSLLKKFKENYNARISRHNDMCSKKRW